MKNDAMLAAIAADPDDDMRRLAYADWLDENTNRQVDLSCSNCNGRGKHKRGYCDAFMYSCGELGVDDGDCPHMKELISCGVCRSTGVITTNPDHDRAELIRVQCESERIRGGGCAVVLGDECNGSKEWCIRCCHIKRASELIAAHPEWTQWPCSMCLLPPSNLHGPCLACLGTGDMLKGRRITWDRGWPGWIHVERVGELVQWRNKDNGLTAPYPQPYPTIIESEEQWEIAPTPLLTALATTPPWGVPLRGVIVEELKPYWNGMYWCWYHPNRSYPCLEVVYMSKGDLPQIECEGWYVIDDQLRVQAGPMDSERIAVAIQSTLEVERGTRS